MATIEKKELAGGMLRESFFKIVSGTELTNKFNRLEPINKDNSIEEGIQARIKDPCWLLGRQWQMGEFKAENGGTPVRTEISYIKQPVNTIIKGKTSASFDLKEPLEEVVENDATKEKGWNSKRLEYSFKIKGKEISLSANEYDGNNLEWYHFNIDSQAQLQEEEIEITAIPQPLRYVGMPHPRWWRFEDQKIDVGNIQRPYLNYLTMLLMEFSLFYSNDWYISPLDHEVGYIRKISRFNVIDSFGVVTEMKPVVDPSEAKKGWEAFTLSPNNANAKSDGSVFYMPNTLMGGALESEPIEEVSLMRDELANLVWAIEHKYQKGNGEIVSRHDEELSERQSKVIKEDLELYYWDYEFEQLVKREDIEDKSEIGHNYLGPLAKYNFMSYLPPYWIPYVAKQISGMNGEIILRRGTTHVGAGEETELNSSEESKSKSRKGSKSVVPENTQYKGVFLKESPFIYEEEVPKSGVLLKRVWQLARDIDGNYYNWLGRKKTQDMRRKSSGLRFDYLKTQK